MSACDEMATSATSHENPGVPALFFAYRSSSRDVELGRDRDAPGVFRSIVRLGRADGQCRWRLRCRMAQSAAVAIWLDAVEDRQRHCARRPPDAGHELPRELPEPLHGGRPERIRDIRPVMLGLHPAGLPENLQVMRDCRLGDGAAGREVARTHGAFVA